MSGTEQQRLVALNRVLMGDLTAAEAADALGRSVRQVRRMLAAYRKEDADALVHGNRGRTPTHALEAGMRQQVVDLARTTVLEGELTLQVEGPLQIVRVPLRVISCGTLLSSFQSLPCRQEP